MQVISYLNSLIYLENNVYTPPTPKCSVICFFRYNFDRTFFFLAAEKKMMMVDDGYYQLQLVHYNRDVYQIYWSITLEKTI